MIQVLIVEDDPMVAKINEKYLEAVDGFESVGILSDPSKTLAFLDENPVDLIMLDIFMPIRNGMDLLSDIRNNNKSVDVIVISAASDIQTIKLLLRLGVVDYLIKPFEFERFHSALRIYQKEHEFLKKQERISQNELDSLFHYKNHTNVVSEPPKGLTQTTLQRVVACIFEMKTEGFSTESLARKVGISRVSMRKYLGFLAEIAFVNVDLNYQTSGRPVYQYHLNETNTEIVTPYLGEAN